MKTFFALVFNAIHNITAILFGTAACVLFMVYADSVTSKSPESGSLADSVFIGCCLGFYISCIAQFVKDNSAKYSSVAAYCIRGALAGLAYKLFFVVNFLARGHKFDDYAQLTAMFGELALLGCFVGLVTKGGASIFKR